MNRSSRDAKAGQNKRGVPVSPRGQQPQLQKSIPSLPTLPLPPRNETAVKSTARSRTAAPAAAGVGGATGEREVILTPRRDGGTPTAQQQRRASARVSPRSGSAAARGSRRSSNTGLNRTRIVSPRAPLIPSFSDESGGTGDAALHAGNAKSRVSVPSMVKVHIRIRPPLPALGEAYNARNVWAVDNHNVVVRSARAAAGRSEARMRGRQGERWSASSSRASSAGSRSSRNASPRPRTPPGNVPDIPNLKLSKITNFMRPTSTTAAGGRTASGAGAPASARSRPTTARPMQPSRSNLPTPRRPSTARAHLRTTSTGGVSPLRATGQQRPALERGGGRSSRPGAADTPIGLGATARQHADTPSAGGFADDGGEQHFAFELVHFDEATQEEVFEESVLDFVDCALTGQNVAILCYGPTGSGKTYTMMGPPPRSAQNRSESRRQSTTLEVKSRPVVTGKKVATTEARTPRGPDGARTSSGIVNTDSAVEGESRELFPAAGADEKDTKPDTTRRSRSASYEQMNEGMGLLPRLVGVLLTKRGQPMTVLYRGSPPSASSTAALEKGAGKDGTGTHTTAAKSGSAAAASTDRARGRGKGNGSTRSTTPPPPAPTTTGEGSSETAAAPETVTPASTGKAQQQQHQHQNATLTLRDLHMYGVELYLDDIFDILDSKKRRVSTLADTGGLSALCVSLEQARAERSKKDRTESKRRVNSSGTSRSGTTTKRSAGSTTGTGKTKSGSSANLKSAINGGGGVRITSLEGLHSCYKLACGNRVTSAHLKNDTSSRSHAVFILRLTFDLTDPEAPSSSGAPTDDQTGNAKESAAEAEKKGVSRSMFSYVAMVDLAGSERVKETRVEGIALKEAQYINKSLSALSSVVLALHRNASHVPFRDSKLTRLLRPCLEGGCVLTLVHVPPCCSSGEDAAHALKFAERIRHMHVQGHSYFGGNKELLSLLQEATSPAREALEEAHHFNEFIYKQICAEVRIAAVHKESLGVSRPEALAEPSPDADSAMRRVNERVYAVSQLTGNYCTRLEREREAQQTRAKELIEAERDAAIERHAQHMQHRIAEMQTRLDEADRLGVQLKEGASAPLGRDGSAANKMRVLADEFTFCAKEKLTLSEGMVALRQRYSVQGELLVELDKAIAAATMDRQREKALQVIPQSTRVIQAEQVQLAQYMAGLASDVRCFELTHGIFEGFWAKEVWHETLALLMAERSAIVRLLTSPAAEEVLMSTVPLEEDVEMDEEDGRYEGGAAVLGAPQYIPAPISSGGNGGGLSASRRTDPHALTDNPLSPDDCATDSSTNASFNPGANNNNILSGRAVSGTNWSNRTFPPSNADGDTESNVAQLRQLMLTLSTGKVLYPARTLRTCYEDEWKLQCVCLQKMIEEGLAVEIEYRSQVGLDASPSPPVPSASGARSGGGGGAGSPTATISNASAAAAATRRAMRRASSSMRVRGRLWISVSSTPKGSRLLSLDFVADATSSLSASMTHPSVLSTDSPSSLPKCCQFSIPLREPQLRLKLYAMEDNGLSCGSGSGSGSSVSVTGPFAALEVDGLPLMSSGLWSTHTGKSSPHMQNLLADPRTPTLSKRLDRGSTVLLPALVTDINGGGQSIVIFLYPTAESDPSDSFSPVSASPIANNSPTAGDAETVAVGPGLNTTLDTTCESVATDLDQLTPEMDRPAPGGDPTQAVSTGPHKCIEFLVGALTAILLPPSPAGTTGSNASATSAAAATATAASATTRASSVAHGSQSLSTSRRSEPSVSGSVKGREPSRQSVSTATSAAPAAGWTNSRGSCVVPYAHVPWLVRWKRAKRGSEGAGERNSGGPASRGVGTDEVLAYLGMADGELKGDARKFLEGDDDGSEDDDEAKASMDSAPVTESPPWKCVPTATLEVYFVWAPLTSAALRSTAKLFFSEMDWLAGTDPNWSTWNTSWKEGDDEGDHRARGWGALATVEEELRHIDRMGKVGRTQINQHLSDALQARQNLGFRNAAWEERHGSYVEDVRREIGPYLSEKASGAPNSTVPARSATIAPLLVAAADITAAPTQAEQFRCREWWRAMLSDERLAVCHVSIPVCRECFEDVFPWTVWRWAYVWDAVRNLYELSAFRVDEAASRSASGIAGAHADMHTSGLATMTDSEGTPTRPPSRSSKTRTRRRSSPSLPPSASKRRASKPKDRNASTPTTVREDSVITQEQQELDRRHQLTSLLFMFDDPPCYLDGIVPAVLAMLGNAAGAAM